MDLAGAVSSYWGALDAPTMSGLSEVFTHRADPILDDAYRSGHSGVVKGRASFEEHGAGAIVSCTSADMLRFWCVYDLLDFIYNLSELGH